MIDSILTWNSDVKRTEFIPKRQILAQESRLPLLGHPLQPIRQMSLSSSSLRHDTNMLRSFSAVRPQIMPFELYSGVAPNWNGRSKNPQRGTPFAVVQFRIRH